MKLHDRVKRLLRSAPEFVQQGHKVRQERQRRAAAEEWRRRAEEVRAQMNQLLRASHDHIPEDQRPAVEAALAYREEHPDDRDYPGSIEKWFHDICEGQSRLPPDLSAETMCRLVLVRLLEREHLDGMELVCEACGLQHPHHKLVPASECGRCKWKGARGAPTAHPEFFPNGCLYCGSPAFVAGSSTSMWAHRILEKHYPWMDLPGYVGPRPRPRWAPGK
jgi:hypothetical protein